MTGASLILAAHGAGDDSPANLHVRDLAAALHASGKWYEVVAAFNRGTPGFAEALAGLPPGRVVVVPVMTSDGFFRERVLPAALQECDRPERWDIRVTPSLGSRRELVDIVEMLATTAAARFQVSAADATLLIIGHGTRRHAHSGDTVRSACRALRRRAIFARVEAAFLDEPPLVEEYMANAETSLLIAVPFLIGGGQHAQMDVPQRLGMDALSHTSEPACAEVRGRRIIRAQSVGSHPGVREIVEALATEASLLTHASTERGQL